MRKTKIRTVDVIALEWFDKVNGNSYFAGSVTVNYGMKSAREYKMPYQYGYGEHYVDMARKKLEDAKEIQEHGGTFSIFCRSNHIILRTTKHENCKKSQLKAI